VCHRGLLDLHAGISVTARLEDWWPWAHVRPVTFLALLERHSLRALAALSAGGRQLLLSSSLLLDHCSSGLDQALITYCAREPGRLGEEMREGLQAQLQRACGLLSRLLVSPLEAVPVGALHKTDDQRPEEVEELSAGQREKLAALARRACALLLVIAVNSPGSSEDGASAAAACVALVVQLNKQGDGAPLLQLLPQGSCEALWELGASLEALRERGSALDATCTNVLAPLTLLPTLQRVMDTGGDALVRLTYKSLQPPRELAWAEAVQGLNVEARVGDSSQHGPSGARLGFRLAVPRLVRLVEAKASEGTSSTCSGTGSGSDSDGDGDSDADGGSRTESQPRRGLPPRSRNQTRGDRRAAAQPTRGVTVQGEAAGSEEGQRVAATVARLGRRVWVCARLWLARARHGMLSLKPAQGARADMRARFHELWEAECSGGGGGGGFSLVARSGLQWPQLQEVAAEYLAHVCPVQVKEPVRCLCALCCKAPLALPQLSIHPTSL
jgi:hypothetical protein